MGALRNGEPILKNKTLLKKIMIFLLGILICVNVIIQILGELNSAEIDFYLDCPHMPPDTIASLPPSPYFSYERLSIAVEATRRSNITHEHEPYYVIGNGVIKVTVAPSDKQLPYFRGSNNHFQCSVEINVTWDRNTHIFDPNVFVVNVRRTDECNAKNIPANVKAYIDASIQGCAESRDDQMLLNSPLAEVIEEDLNCAMSPSLFTPMIAMRLMNTSLNAEMHANVDRLIQNIKLHFFEDIQRSILIPDLDLSWIGGNLKAIDGSFREVNSIRRYSPVYNANVPISGACLFQVQLIIESSQILWEKYSITGDEDIFGEELSVDLTDLIVDVVLTIDFNQFQCAIVSEDIYIIDASMELSESTELPQDMKILIKQALPLAKDNYLDQLGAAVNVSIDTAIKNSNCDTLELLTLVNSPVRDDDEIVYFT